jgi:hypothetical protein
MGHPQVIGFKPEVVLWLMVAVHQMLIWNVHFENWEHGWSDHNNFWTQRLLPPESGLPVYLLNFSGVPALLAALCLSTRWRPLMTIGLLCFGLPYLAMILYHWWIPYLFGCCGFWYHGASYAGLRTNSTSLAKRLLKTPTQALKLFQAEYQSSINLLPTIHKASPLFVDLTNIVLTFLVVAAVYYSLKGIIRPYSEEEIMLARLRESREQEERQKKNT